MYGKREGFFGGRANRENVWNRQPPLIFEDGLIKHVHWVEGVYNIVSPSVRSPGPKPLRAWDQGNPARSTFESPASFLLVVHSELGLSALLHHIVHVLFLMLQGFFLSTLGGPLLCILWRPFFFFFLT